MFEALDGIMVDKAVLTALASKFTIVPTTGTSPLKPILNIEAPAEARNPGAPPAQPLSITDVNKTVEMVDVPRMKIDFSFLGKWVRASQIDLPASPAQESLIGGMPIVEQLVLETGTLSSPLTGTPPVPALSGSLNPTLTNTLPPAALMMTKPGSGTVPGVPEVIGQLACTVTDVIERVTEVVQTYPLRLLVEWTVVDDLGSAVAVSYFATPGATTATPLPTPLTLPANGIPVADPQLLSLALTFPAVFSELTSSLPEVLRFTVRARIKLSVTLPAPPPAGTPVDTDWVDLPPVPLVIPTIPVPTILVFCERLDFTGRKLVVVPDNSLIGTLGQGGISVGSALQTITMPALISLMPMHPMFTFLASAAPGGMTAAGAAFTLTSLSPAPNDTIIVARSSIEDLSQFVFDPGGFLNIGRFTAATMARSLIAIGRPGAIFDMYRDWNLSVASGTQLEITLDMSLGCAIRDLTPNDPSATPSTIVYPLPLPTPSLVTSFSPRWSHDRSIRSLALRPATTRFI